MCLSTDVAASEELVDRDDCPFCTFSEQQVYEVDVQTWAVYCPGCQAMGPHAKSDKDAIYLWGRRTRDRAETLEVGVPVHTL